DLHVVAADSVGRRRIERRRAVKGEELPVRLIEGAVEGVGPVGEDAGARQRGAFGAGVAGDSERAGESACRAGSEAHLDRAVFAAGQGCAAGSAIAVSGRGELAVAADADTRDIQAARRAAGVRYGKARCRAIEPADLAEVMAGRCQCQRGRGVLLDFERLGLARVDAIARMSVTVGRIQALDADGGAVAAIGPVDPQRLGVGKASRYREACDVLPVAAHEPGIAADLPAAEAAPAVGLPARAAVV